MFNPDKVFIYTDTKTNSFVAVHPYKPQEGTAFIYAEEMGDLESFTERAHNKIKEKFDSSFNGGETK